VQVLVLAKTPVPGRVKTRLCPPLTPEGAARVAAAAIDDTLDAVRATPVARRVLVVDGPLTAEGFLPAGAARRPARRAPRRRRTTTRAPPACPPCSSAWTPRSSRPRCSARRPSRCSPPTPVLGLAEDGGWWALGLARPTAPARRRPDLPRRHRRPAARRLVEAGLSVVDLPVLRDVDTVDDARAVAALRPTAASPDARRGAGDA
jgi:glycosyltransferase A (GT-A) superfamily protein (DUF2064 family)